MTIREKKILASEKIGGNQFQFGNKNPYVVYFNVFWKSCGLIISKKNAWLPPIFFWIKKALAKICFSRNLVLNDKPNNIPLYYKAPSLKIVNLNSLLLTNHPMQKGNTMKLAALSNGILTVLF